MTAANKDRAAGNGTPADPATARQTGVPDRPTARGNLSDPSYPLEQPDAHLPARRALHGNGDGFPVAPATLRSSSSLLNQRVRVDGKLFRRGNTQLRIHGVTYGPFSPNAAGE